MAKTIQDNDECKITGTGDNSGVCQEVRPKTWVLYVKYDGGIGWAIVNAPNVPMAQGIFLRQTKFVNPKIIQLQELKFFGEEWQICYEDGVSLEYHN